MTSAQAVPGVRQASTCWTHREYFRRYKLNVEQYGEILIADLFGGDKKGDAQPCFDVEAPLSCVRERFIGSGISPTTVNTCLSGLSDTAIRIEVKSKLARTAIGLASVIHCSDHKIEGTRGHLAATHFAVILFGAGGIAERAWFLSTRVASELRRKDTKSKYIPVRALREASRDDANGIIDICSLINSVADGAWRELSVATTETR